MKNLALIAAIIGASSAAFAHAGNLGELHGYATPFAQKTVKANAGQHADAGQFGRISGYGNAINKDWNVSTGQYADVSEFGRLNGYTRPEIVNNTAVAAR